MPLHTTASHTIRVQVPIAQCQRLFTPAGEERWVDGWTPRYLFPTDGRTEPGMVFTTGEGDEFTIWTMVEFDEYAHHLRYSRVTPASRCGFVDVGCTAAGEHATDVDVRYTLTALTPAGEQALEGFAGAAYVEMIEGWRRAIDARLPALLHAPIR